MAVMLVILLSFLVKDAISQAKMVKLKSSSACSIGAVSENNHVRCICTSENIYNCVLKDKSNVIIEDRGKSAWLDETFCQPNTAYEQDTMTCICNKNGTWPHIKCAEVLKSLPEKTVIKIECEPNTYVNVDCNVCRCNLEGRIDGHHCTKNECRVDSRRASENKKLYGDCECGNWYSLAPCQFCYCVNSNKLVCNTGTSVMTNDIYLQLGAYNLHICGKGLMRELRDLERNNRGVLRQGREIDIVEPHTELSSSKPSTLPKPSTPPPISDTPRNVQEIKKNNINKQILNAENIVADNTSSDSDDSKQEPKGLEISDAVTFKQSTKLPYDDEDEDEPIAQSEEQTLSDTKNNFQTKAVKKEKAHKDLERHEYNEKQDEKQYHHHIGRQENYQQELDRQEDNSEQSQLAGRSGNYREQDIPTQDYYQKLRQEESDNDEAGSVSSERQIPVSNKMSLASQASIEPRQENLDNKHEDIAFNMKVDLPSVLGKVLNLALRKSMITINPEKNCTPGTVDAIKCNTCFCLKNGKLLCTTKKCY
ncbi:hypothetical protein evm_004513 [Chilo suppressalis]|nr:hypothetical protein evm_004513 [Chilo suppressalis]